MNKIKYLIVAFVLLTTLLISCDKEDDISDPKTEEVVLNEPISNFVWKAMSSWYNWKDAVPNLADTKDDDVNAYYTFLNGYGSPEQLFDALLYDAGNTDRFSWFIEDYVEQEKAFQGISKTFGFRSQAVKINNTDIIFYVRYVAKNSPASQAGIERGAIFNAINGAVVTDSNYDNVIGGLYEDTVTLSFVSESGGVLTSVGNKTLTAVELSEDPVYLTKVFDNINGKKVGYLVYNGFRSSYNDELNDAFALFKSAGISELILDLRINGGGSVETSAFLASMIYKNANTETFAELKFNSKHSNENGEYNFSNTLNVYNVNGTKESTQAINRLTGINQLYVLTSSSTASASEMIINGLKPFITVKTVGTTTYGKNVGSITLYDSPNSDYTSQASAKTYHKNAMQPIVFQIFNKLGQSDYTQGFPPTIEIKEWNYWNTILPYGDENEVVLKKALDDIRGFSSKADIKPASEFAKALDMKNLDNKFEKEMYIKEDFFNKN
jgi:C-terminal processing protease CtpA/Prc